MRCLFFLDATPSAEHPLGVLKAHVARANPLWQRHDPAHKVLVVFKGPQAYVSPSWYATKAEHGKVVPTWNYIVVQASGHMTPQGRRCELAARSTRRHDAQPGGPARGPLGRERRTG
jgi:transcriptional regulator